MVVRRRVNAYEALIDGAKEGFHTTVTTIPYLVAMLVAMIDLRKGTDSPRTYATRGEWHAGSRPGKHANEKVAKGVGILYR